MFSPPTHHHRHLVSIVSVPFFFLISKNMKLATVDHPFINSLIRLLALWYFVACVTHPPVTWRLVTSSHPPFLSSKKKLWKTSVLRKWGRWRYWSQWRGPFLFQKGKPLYYANELLVAVERSLPLFPKGKPLYYANEATSRSGEVISKLFTFAPPCSLDPSAPRNPECITFISFAFLLQHFAAILFFFFKIDRSIY